MRAAADHEVIQGDEQMSDPLRREADDGARRHFWRNYAAHSLEGGLFLGGMTFVSATTLLPTIVRTLHGPVWLVSLMPMMMAVGVLLPPIFTAHAIDRLRRYMPMLLVTGVFQRLPYLLAGLALLYGAEASPMLALVAAALAPLVSGVFCGVGFTGWQQLLIQTVPQRRRSGLFAVRCVLCCLIGLAAGWVAKVVLAARPGAEGYGVLYLCAFGMLAVSYVAFATIRETPSTLAPPDASPGLVANLRAMPGLIARHRQFRRYLLVSTFSCGVFIVMPFLAIHARRVLGRPESWLGELLMVQMAGAIAGNVLAGWLGDRRGGKAVLMTGAAAWVCLAAASTAAASDLAFRAIFFAMGFAYYTQMIGGMTLSLEISPTSQRATCLAILAFVRLLSMLTAAGISAAIGNGDGRFAWAAGATVLSVGVALYLAAGLREPRGRAAA